MQPAGREILARWRESGEWWSCEQPKEFTRTIVEGALHTTEHPLVAETSTPREDLTTVEEDFSEEIALQKRARKNRDSWSEYASKRLNEGFYESYKAKDGRKGGTHSFAIPSQKPTYVPLHIASGYSFGVGVMHAADIPALAAMRGCPAACITDRFSLIGAVEFSRAAKKIGVKPLIGASLELDLAQERAKHLIGGEIVLIARSKLGYRNLSRLISECHLHEPRLSPLCNWERLERNSTGLLCLTGGEASPINQFLSHGDTNSASKVLERLIRIFGRDNVFVEIERSWSPWEGRVNRLLLDLADSMQVPAVAGGIVTHETRSQFPAQDILTCIESLCTVDEIIGRKPYRDSHQTQVKQRPKRWINAERHLKSACEMTELFVDRIDLLHNTWLVAERCDDDVLPGRTKLPGVTEDDDANLYLITWQGARARHRTIGKRLERRIEHELDRIINLGYSSHFLTMWDTCQWADSQDILFSGRGSVVDSAVAYCLGFSRIDAFKHNLHFDRFLPSDGSKRPDIDIDFEAHRRDDVRNYLSTKFGSDHVATVSAIGTFGTRGIIREVGKAMGLSDAVIGQFAKLIHGGVSPERLEDCLQSRPELRDSGIPTERFKWIIDLAPMIADLPRNIRSHSSGVVISSEPICETVPIMFSGADNVKIIHWDKRSAKHYFDKFDILCLRGQDVLSGTQKRIRASQTGFNVEQISLDNPETYRTMRSGQLIGIPQSASPAMRQAHIRLKTNDLHDASLVQAGIRPGVGGAVKLNELIARRRGKPYTYLHPDFEAILGHTYGIIVFQEQVDQLLQTFCGYSSGEAEAIREAIHENRKRDYGQTIREELYERITSQGHSLEIADHVFDLVAGFKGYGFAQGHALAFAEISIRSIHCQQNYPAEYFAALLDAQPAGYYGPCTLANEARTRGVTILRVDVNRSEHKFKVEDVKSEQDPKIILPNAGLRVSLDQIGGISDQLRQGIVQRRPFFSFYDFVTRVQPERDELERLILCGAFDDLHPNRRALLWAIPIAFEHASSVRAMAKGLQMPLTEPAIPDGVEDFLQHEKAIFERSILGMDVRTHLMAYERERVRTKGVITGAEVDSLASGEKAIVVGNPIRLRFPPTASGKRVVFFDLEDESGLLNVTCFDDVYRRDGHAIVSSAYVTIRGEAQDRDGHIAFLANRIYPYKPQLNLNGLAQVDQLFDTADFLAR